MTSVHDLQVTRVPVAGLHLYFKNPRRGNVPAIAGSLKVNGQYKPVVVNRGTHTGRPDEVLAGNHTVMAARDLEWESVDVVHVDVDEDAAARIVAADNRTADMADYDVRLLLELLGDLPDLDGTGYEPGDLTELEEQLRLLDQEGWDGEGGGKRADPVNLAERFGVPPFTVLDTRQGYWRRRKAGWLALGIRSEIGRNAEEGDGIVFNSAERRDPQFYRLKAAVEAELGREISTPEFLEQHYQAPDTAITSGTSIFDPVLCEAMVRWHCPPRGVVIDPFAGGSVRGVVAAALGRRYFGGELRGQQVEANREQWGEIRRGGVLPADAPEPVWVAGDSRQLVGNFERRPPPADMLFTCPPYADLEVYSEDPADLSNMTYTKFLTGYRECLGQAVELLRDDSFAVLVVGEVRGKKQHGTYYGFVPDTIAAMAKLGLGYYSNYVLVNMVGSAAMAANRQMSISRKPVHTHQHVLVFVKGDARAAAERSPIDDQIDLPDPDADDEGEPAE